jgi:transcriptional regulator with XRE-family HTH domain
MSSFGERLKAVRLAAGMSQERLGVEAGIQEESASARMNRYERGTRAPAFELVQRIAKALDVPVTYFYASNDLEAELLLAFHRLDKRGKVAAVQAVEGLHTGSK